MFKVFVKEQIRAKLEYFEGPVKSSKVKSHMNWWVKCISAVIAKTASRNVAFTFKAWKLRDSIMEGQDSFIMRELEDAEVDFGEDCEDVVADVGNNADLYAANQESTELINEAHMEEARPSLGRLQGTTQVQVLRFTFTMGLNDSCYVSCICKIRFINSLLVSTKRR